jgi:antitoxin PrlF
MTVQSTITSKGQTTIPREVREALDLKPGDKLRYRIGDDGAVQLVRSRSILEAAGMLWYPGIKPMTLEEMDDAIAEGAIRSGNS